MMKERRELLKMKKTGPFFEMELLYEGYQVEKAFDGRTGLEPAQSESLI